MDRRFAKERRRVSSFTFGADFVTVVTRRCRDILKLRKEQHSKAEPTSVEEPFVTKNIVQQNLQDLVNPPNLIGVSGERVKTTTKLKDEWRRGWQVRSTFNFMV